MIAPDDYMAHLKSLDKFHRTLQCPPLLSLHRMGLPSSDFVTETFLQLLTLPPAINCSQHCAIIPPTTYEFRFTYPDRHQDFGIPHWIHWHSSDVGIMLTVLLFPWGSIDIHKAIPYGETTLAQVDRSIGNAFIQSLDDRMKHADEVTCRVRGRGGQETMFWDTQEVSTLSTLSEDPTPLVSMLIS